MTAYKSTMSRYALIIVVALTLLLLTLQTQAQCQQSYNPASQTLGMDQAALRMTLNISDARVTAALGNLTPFSNRLDCHNCLYTAFYRNAANLSVNTLSNTYCRLNSAHSWQMQWLNASKYALNGTRLVLGNTTVTLGERGLYTLHIFPVFDLNSSTPQQLRWNYTLHTDVEPIDSSVDLLYAVPIIILLLLVAWLLTHETCQALMTQIHAYVVSDHSLHLGCERLLEKRRYIEYETPGAEEGHVVSKPFSSSSTSINSTSINSTNGLHDEQPVRSSLNGESETRVAKPATLQQPLLADGLSQRADGKARLLCLDTFRGISLSFMIFVNLGGGGYWWMDHASWDGLQVADLLFPWFIWQMGFSMALSTHSLQKRNATKGEQLLKILRRSFILFFLGLLVSNGGTTLANLRIPGVLQRFSTSYLIVGLIMLALPKRPFRNQEHAWLIEFWPYWPEYLAVGFLLALHTFITFTVTADGCPPGYLGPGGLSDQGQYQHCVGGAAGVIDRYLLGVNHIYGGPTCKDPYNCDAYDPEGILGILTSSGLCYLGVIAGRVFLFNKTHQRRLARWMLGCICCGLVALTLCGGTQYDGVIPVSKNLWSMSFIFTLASFAFFNISWLYLLMDVQKLWNGAPFKAMGQNSILIYVFSETIGNNSWPFAFQLDQPDSHGTRLTQNVAVVAMHWLLAAYAASVGFFVNI